VGPACQAFRPVLKTLRSADVTAEQRYPFL
jgi:hypothetical protein